MRLEHSPEIPRREVPKPTAPSIEASPIEVRRERLHAQAQQRRMPTIPRPASTDVQKIERQREPTERSQHHSIEHRQRRDQIPPQAIGISLREEEKKILAEVGRFRVVNVRDLGETVYQNNAGRMERDLRYLRQHGLIQTEHVNTRRDGRLDKVERIEVVTLTKAGKEFLRQTGDLPSNQTIYSGLVKPREAEHDAQIYRAYLKQAERIERRGGTNLRVKLDFELKSEVQKAIYAARQVDDRRDLSEIKQQVAAQFDLPYTRDHIQIPDARIVYDLNQEQDQGSRSGHADIEVLTAAYRPGHIQAKAQSGFHVYASSADRASLGFQVEDEHGMTRDILDL